MARYIDADKLIEELKLLEMFITGMRCGKTLITEFVAEYKKSALRLIDEQPTADVAPKSEVASKICGEINGEIADALASNYRVIRDALEHDELYYTAYGKISALRGILDFIAELKKKYKEEKK